MCASVNQCLLAAGVGDGMEPVTTPEGGGGGSGGGMDGALRAGDAAVAMLIIRDGRPG